MPQYKAIRAFWELLSANWSPFATGSQPYLIPYHADFPTNRQYNTIEYAALIHRPQTELNDAVPSHPAHPTSIPLPSSSHNVPHQRDTRHQALGTIPDQTYIHNEDTRRHTHPAASPPSNTLEPHTKPQTPPVAKMHSSSTSSSSSSTSSNTSTHHAHRALSTIQAIYSARPASPVQRPATPHPDSDIAPNPQDISPTTISTVLLSPTANSTPPTQAPWPHEPAREPLLPLLSPQVSPLVTGFHADVGASLEPFPAFHDDGEVEHVFGYGGVDLDGGVEGGGGERRRWDLGGGGGEGWDTEWWVWVYVWVCGVVVLGAVVVLIWGLVH